MSIMNRDRTTQKPPTKHAGQRPVHTQEGAKSAPTWWRGLDLNQRPSGYEREPPRRSGLVEVGRSGSHLRFRVRPTGEGWSAPGPAGRSYAVIALSTDEVGSGRLTTG
jgi:hypothetical protein